MKKLFTLILMALLPILANAYDFEVDGIFYNITSIEDKTVEVTYSTYLNYQQNYIVIPSEVTWNNYNFIVKGIGICAFDGFNYPNKVDTIIISKGIEYIEELAFQSQRLKMIRIPNTVKTIGSNAFSAGNEGNITTDWYVEDYEWLCTIGHFFSYPHVKDIYIGDKKLDGDIVIPEGVPYISSYFWGCDWIRSLSIPSTVSYMSGSFIRCTNLESVVFKEGIKNIYGQFSGCINLRSVTLPNSLVSIGGSIFDNCPALIDIQSFITEPFPTNSFTNGQYLSATLTIPHGTKAKYMAVDGWKNFVNIQERDGNTPEPPKPEKCATPTISYVNGKLIFDCETEDVLFHSTITDMDITSYLIPKIELGVTYNVSVYATKTGYIDSDVATATLCWIDVEPATEGIVDEDAVTEVKAVPVLIQTQGGNIIIQGAAEGTPIAIYGIDGKEYGSATSEKDRTTIATSLRPGSVAVVKIGEKVIKVAIK